MKKIAIVVSHPIQYLAPLFSALAKKTKIKVFYGKKLSAKEQGASFGKSFEWDRPVLVGYPFCFVERKLESSLGQFKPEAIIVLGWNSKLTLEAISYAHQNKIPIFAFGDSQLAARPMWFNFLKWPFWHFYLKKFNGFLSPGKRFSQYLKFYGVSQTKIFKCRYSVDNDFFAKFKNSQKHKNMTFLFCGKLIVKKRPLDFLKAIKIVSAKNIKALVAGDGPLRKGLESFVQKNHLPVDFLGFINQSQLPSVYTSADWLVLPSDGRETWGLVVNEAAACGVPTIASSACGAVGDLVLNNKTGFVYPVGDFRRLAKIIKKVASDAKIKRRICKDLDQHLQEFSPENSALQILKAIEK